MTFFGAAASWIPHASRVSKVRLSRATTFFGLTGTVTAPWASVTSTVVGSSVLAGAGSELAFVLVVFPPALLALPQATNAMVMMAVRMVNNTLFMNQFSPFFILSM